MSHKEKENRAQMAVRKIRKQKKWVAFILLTDTFCRQKLK